MKELAELYKEFHDKAQALYDEFEARAKEVSPNVQVHNPFTVNDSIQIYPDAPTEGAEYYFETDDTIFYTLNVDGVRIVEAVDKCM